MTWRCLNLLPLLVALTLIHPSEENCNDSYFNMKSKSWKNPPQRVELVRTNNSMDVMECSLERLCIEHKKLCHILRDCFRPESEKYEPLPTQISEKCKGENYTRIQFFHFMCWLAKAAHMEAPPDYCDDYGSLCDTYSNITFPPRTDQTTLPPTTNARTTPPESTTNATTPPESTTNATTPPESTTNATTLPESTTNATTLPESTTVTTALTTTTPPESTITTTTTTTLQTATTKTTKATPSPTGNSGGRMGMRESSQETENLALKIVLTLSLITNVAGLLYLCMRRRRGLMMQQNGQNEGSIQSQSNTNLANTSGNEQTFLMQPPNSSQA